MEKFNLNSFFRVWLDHLACLVPKVSKDNVDLGDQREIQDLPVPRNLDLKDYQVCR